MLAAPSQNSAHRAAKSHRAAKGPKVKSHSVKSANKAPRLKRANRSRVN
jgi:hypothetical protein